MSENAKAQGSNGKGPRVAPIVIGHRGASGYRPEHTLAAYSVAIEMGADFIEPDLVATRDGKLVVRHENEIAGTTDVSARPEFAARKTTKTIDGVAVTGWFTEDFTLAELKTLRAKERLPALRKQNVLFDGKLEIPTFEEVIALAQTESQKRGRAIGLYPETKHPSYFQSIGLPLEDELLRALDAAGYHDHEAPVFIQSFERKNLQQLRSLTRLPLVQLMDAAGGPFGDTVTYADMVTPGGLEAIATYADGVGLNKNLIVPRDASQKLLSPTTVVNDAHAAGLLVHAWTFRAENNFLPLDYRVGADVAARGDFHDELKLFFGLGLDGLFSDQPDVPVAVRSALGFK